MRLSKYLELKGESVGGFSRRAGLTHNTIKRIVDEEGPNGPTVANAWKIVAASRSQPTPGGGTVTFEDLIPVREDAA